MTPANPANEYGNADASYQAAGGIDGIRKLVDDFYLLLDSEPLARDVRAMHSASLDMARDKLACFLSGWLGGPRLFSEKYGSISIPAFHAKWPIDQAHSEAWLHCMKLAIERQDYSADFAQYLLRQLRIPAERVVQASTNRRAAQQ
ncbi:group II truncated hemoglobin [Pseudomonas sp.]|uniref:group II truncated hemoglobin n=1 Tax=Pseudomonas sp. TaxID=306 RepID=UPI003A97C3ED